MRPDSPHPRSAGRTSRRSAGFSYLTSLPRALRADVRAQSEVLGAVLLVGIVVVATATLALYGSAAIADNEERIAVERAANGLEQFDTRASRVALGESDVQRMDVGVTGTSGSLDTRPNDGWITVEIVNATTGVTNTTVVDKQPLGALVYRYDDTTVAYQGGGVWRSDGDGSAMISRPEFHVRNDTLTLPIVVTGGSGGVYSDVQVRPDESHPNGSVETKFPDPERNLTNKIQTVKLRITVQSDYYEAWGRYFEDHTDGYVYVDHGANTATVTYLSEPRWFGLGSGLVATSGSSEVRFGGSDVKIDSYNSSQGSYADTQGENGTLTASNDVVDRGGAVLKGDIYSGGVVSGKGTSTIAGTIYWTEGYERGGNAAAGGNEQIDGVAALEPIDGYVQNTVAAAQGSNNNSEVPGVISDAEFTGPGTLTAGTYYFENLSVGPGETLNVDTSGGDVVIAVRDSFYIGGTGGKMAEINVTGDGTASVFVLGDSTGGYDFEMDDNAQITVPRENSSQFRLFGTSEFQADMMGSNSDNKAHLFEGVIYAPAGRYGTGSVSIQQFTLYGAIVSGNLDIDQGAEIHFDEALNHARFPRSPTLTRIEFMHITVHRIRLTSG